MPLHHASADTYDRLTLRPQLAAVRERFVRRARDRGAEIDVTVPDGLVVVADPLRLEQALANLIDNALRHGGKHVQLSAEPSGDTLELHVRDDGPGFPVDFVDSAFERFIRADTARGRGGPGLGLAIVAVIARAHGGAVGAQNRPGAGADVWLALPAPVAEAVPGGGARERADR